MTKVLIADDQQIFRECLKFMIEKSSDIEVIACAADGREAINLCRSLSPQVVLMDIMMPVCDGIEATREIKKMNKDIKILVLTTEKDSKSVTDAMRNGADGYILKSVSKEDLILSIKGVMSDLEILHKEIKAMAKNLPKDKISKSGRIKEIEVNGFTVELSERELIIIKAIIDGEDNSDIAAKLFIAEGRLRNIITEIISKLMLKDRTQLAVFAIKHNLV